MTTDPTVVVTIGPSRFALAADGQVIETALDDAWDDGGLATSDAAAATRVALLAAESAARLTGYAPDRL